MAYLPHVPHQPTRHWHKGPGKTHSARQHVSEDATISSEEFMMFAFKVLPCCKTYSHDWWTCPYAHKGEKAKRRDPRVYDYEAVACPNGKHGKFCRNGDLCKRTHSVFEYWLHPTRFRTEICVRGIHCKKAFCFFAHTHSQLRYTDQPHHCQQYGQGRGHSTAGSSAQKGPRGNSQGCSNRHSISKGNQYYGSMKQDVFCSPQGSPYRSNHHDQQLSIRDITSKMNGFYGCAEQDEYCSLQLSPDRNQYHTQSGSDFQILAAPTLSSSVCHGSRSISQDWNSQPSFADTEYSMTTSLQPHKHTNTSYAQSIDDDVNFENSTLEAFRTIDESTERFLRMVEDNG